MKSSTAQKVNLLQTSENPAPGEAFIEEEFRVSITGTREKQILNIYADADKWQGRKTYIMPVSGRTYRVYWVEESSSVPGYTFAPYMAEKVKATCNKELVRAKYDLAAMKHLMIPKNTFQRATKLMGKVYEKARCIDITLTDEFFFEGGPLASNVTKLRTGATKARTSKRPYTKRDTEFWGTVGGGRGAKAATGSHTRKGKSKTYQSETETQGVNSASHVSGGGNGVLRIDATSSDVIAGFLRAYLTNEIIYPTIDSLSTRTPSEKELDRMAFAREIEQGFDKWIKKQVK